jgi:DNA repair protein RadA/Sms
VRGRNTVGVCLVNVNKARTQYVCDRCGGVFPQWYGKCPACGAWDSLWEMRGKETVGPAAAARRSGGRSPVPVTEVELAPQPRLPTTVEELDRVLGGGLVPGALVLLAGDPGLGKSTLLMQAGNAFAENHGKCLYVSGEESLQQVAIRSRRLGSLSPDLLLLAETDAEAIEQQVVQTEPGLLIIDSIQAMYAPSVESLPGSVGQVRECALRMMRIAKDLGVPTFLVGHVTREGTIAGPRVLEHMVDTVLALEGDRHSGYRILRAIKNRFGSTDEVGMFHMAQEGLQGVPDASAALLAERRAGLPGSSVTVALEGSRPLLVEVQALVSRGPSSGTLWRSVNGLDYNRTCMVIAILDTRTHLSVADKAAFVNVPGGLRVEEPATDLGLAMAVASSILERPVPPQVAFVGEIGLTGEVRAVPALGRRLAELSRYSFTWCLVPPGKDRGGAPSGLKLVAVENIGDALRIIFPEERDKGGR